MWMRRWLLLPITLIGVPMLGLMGLILTFVLLLSGGEDLSAAACTTTVDTGAQKVDHLDAAQTANASTIVQVGHQMAIPARGWVIAVATAMQESDLRNQTTATDHDSLGLFQQRPSQGWGTPAQLTDPVYAATKFYEHLTKVVGWQNRPLTEVAQAVQRSAFPNAYARHEAAATAVVKSLTGVDAAAAPAAGASAVPNPCLPPTTRPRSASPRDRPAPWSKPRCPAKATHTFGALPARMRLTARGSSSGLGVRRSWRSPDAPRPPTCTDSPTR
jgi:hypothetical protein